MIKQRWTAPYACELTQRIGNQYSASANSPLIKYAGIVSYNMSQQALWTLSGTLNALSAE